MDSIDLRILDTLQRRANVTNERLAEVVGASPASVHRRLKKLESSGVVSGITATVDQNAVGRPLIFIVGLEIERKNPEMYDQLKRWLAAEEAVQQAYNVTGEHDFILLITARTLGDYDGFMDRMLSSNHNIKKFHTNVVLNSFKKSLFIPVLED